MEINGKWITISKLNQRMVMLKEELTCVKEKLHKTDNVNNCRTDKREPLNKKGMEMPQEASKTLWTSQKALETAI